MRSKTSDDYISNRAWFRDVVGGRNLILCGISALEYLELFGGYFGESEIDVYAISKEEYDNINYHIKETFDDIDFFKDGRVLCSTINQVVNDMLHDGNSDEQALVEALSNYFYLHGESFEGLQINPENTDKFSLLKEYASVYYSGG